MMRNMLQGKTIAFTGDLGAMTRKEATVAAQAVGAVVSSSVTQSTDFLIQGYNPTPSKSAKAQANGVTLLNAPQFLQSVANVAPAAVSPPVPAVPQMQQKQQAPQHIEYPPEALAHQAALVAGRMKAGSSAYDAEFDEEEDDGEVEQPYAEQQEVPVESVQPTFVAGNVSLIDKTVAITGTLDAFTRSDYCAVDQCTDLMLSNPIRIVAIR